MRGQDAEANCGPFALMNALRSLGIVRSREELETLCGTTMTAGTSPAKMYRGAGKLGLHGAPTKITERRLDIAMLKLRHALLAEGRPVVMVWHAGEHWVAAVGMLGERFLIADSADIELVISMSAEEVAEKWADGGFHGVVL